MANLLERMGLVHTEYDNLPAAPPIPLPEAPYASQENRRPSFQRGSDPCFLVCEQV